MTALGAAPIAVKSATGMLTAAGVWSGVIVLGLVIVLTWVKILPRLKELQINSNAGLRKEFIDEMHALRDEVRGLRDENDLLRKEIRQLHSVIDGMRRENLAAHLSEQRSVIGLAGDNKLSAPMLRAVKKLDELAGERDDDIK